MPFNNNKFTWQQYTSTGTKQVVHYVCKRNDVYRGQYARMDGSIVAHGFANGTATSIRDIVNFYEARKFIMYGTTPRTNPSKPPEPPPVVVQQQLIAAGDLDKDDWERYYG